MAGGETTETSETVKDLKPPVMITDGSQYPMYEKRLKRWSRLSPLSKQTQFDLILNGIDPTNPLGDKLEEEIGESAEATTKGVTVILDKLKEWFGKEEDIDAFINYKEFEGKSRDINEDVLKFVNEWESLYNKCKAREDTISDRVLAFKLIVSCNLSEMDHKLVFREAKSNEKDGKVFQRTKDAIRMFYNARTLKTLNENKTLVADNLEDNPDDPFLKTLIAKGWKAPKPKNTSRDPKPYKTWFKCKWCRCECDPPDKRCDCPCSKHRPQNCPNKPQTNEVKESETPVPVSTFFASTIGKKLGINNVLLVSSVEEESQKRKVQDLTDFLYSDQKHGQFVNKNPSSTPTNEVLNIHHKLDELKQSEQGAKVIVDTACPKTMTGLQWFKKLFQIMPKAIRSQLVVEKSAEKFQFGGGERRDSLGLVTLPCYVLDDEHQAHMILVKVEIVDADICMLLGGSSLEIAQATLDLGPNMTLTLPTILGPGTRIPLKKAAGHYVFYLFPPTTEDDKDAAISMLENKSWTEEKANTAIAYIIKSKEPDYEAVLHDRVLISKKCRKKNKSNSNESLSLNDVIKLHHYFGHCTPDRLEKLIKRAGKWNQEVANHMEDIRKCQICAVESKRKSLPKTAIPRASNFNQLVTLDLKYNTKYSNKSDEPYILYIIDAFTRYKVAVFIPDKKSTTVIEAFLINWIRIFGRCSTLHFDNGSEFVNSEMQALCDKYDIRITTTAAYSPNQNGLNEKNHHYVDFMMSKIITADPKCTPEIALTWAIHTSNVLENRFGVSPSMLVFGRNVLAHPNINPEAPSTLESKIDVSKRIQAHLEAMTKAREAFIQAESDKTIADALKSKLYHKYEDLEIGNWIYYKNFETNRFQGPTKIVMIDNKKIFTIRNNKLISVNRDHVILQRSESDNLEPLLTLPPLPRQDSADINDNKAVSDEETTAASSQVSVVENDREDSDIIEIVVKPQSPTTDVEEQERRANEIDEEIPASIDEENLDAEVINDGEVDDFAEVGEGTVFPEPTLPQVRDKQVKVACNTCDKEMSQKSIVRHARTKHLLTGKWDEVSRKIGENQSVTTGQVLFISTVQDKNDENEVFHVMIPKSDHSQPSSILAKQKELEHFANYDVYEVVEKPTNAKIIGTQWVIVDKDVPGKQEKIRKARLCMRGDQEENIEAIHTDSPTVNKININLMLIEAVRQGWEISSSDVTRAFLQTSEIDRNVYVRPPLEAGVPDNKVWKLKRPAYGLIDAAHSFFINHAESIISLGCEPCKMDNATYYYFNDGSRPGDEERHLGGIVGSHIDDSLSVSDDNMRKKVLENMKKKFTYGSHENLPFRYVGLNIDENEDGIIINQDHFVENLTSPNLNEISSMKKEDLLPDKYQTEFRSVVSKLNMLSMTSRPDITFEVKILTTKYGKAKKMDIMAASKLLMKVKRLTTKRAIPNLGKVKDWVLVAFSDAATKKIDNAFSVAGYVVFIVNKVTNHAAPITWSSKKIERVVNSSLGAETLGVTKLIGTLYFIKEIYKQMYGTKMGDIPCVTFVDSKDLYEAVHNIKNVQDKRLLGDILQIKQAIAIDGIITELRLLPGSEMLADPLTKKGVNAEALMEVIRSGQLHIPGNVNIECSEKFKSTTWKKLMQAQNEGFESFLED